MLTGGIDLSVGMVASMAAFIMATQTGAQGPVVAIVLALVAAVLAGIVNGIGIGVFKVHPLIMTLGIALVILGLMNVYQLVVVQSGTEIPDIVDWLGSGTTLPFLPNNLFLFIPLALLIIAGLRYSGFGRLLFAIGDNPVAARLSGVRVWQVQLGLYTLSAMLAAIAGILVAGLVKTASLSLVEQSVLPGRGGRGHRRDVDHGRPRRLLGHDHRRAHPDRADQPAHRAPDARGGPPDPVRRDHRRRRGRLHADRRRDRASPGVPAHHLGIDLGVTNLKWATVESDGDEWRILDRGQVPTLSAGGPEAVIARIGRVGTGGDRAPPVDRVARHRRPRPVRPGGRHDPVPRQHAGRLARSHGGRPVVRRARPPGRAHQRCPGVRPRRASPWGGSRRRDRSSG